MINTDQMIAFLASLIRVQTLSGDEAPAIALTEAEMHALRFDRIFTDENGSVVGIIEGGAPGATILLDAHVDTVGIASAAAWTHEPFGAHIEDGRMYGRGTSDMKGALAAMLYAAASLDRAALAGRIVVSASVLEEVMEGVALHTVMDVVRPDYVVIGESTDLNLAHGGRGRAEIHLKATGKPAHSSSPSLGINAVHLMIAAIQKIEALSAPSDPLLGDGIMALTDIISEPYPAYSVLPSECRVTYDRRLLPGETPQSVLSALLTLPNMERIEAQIARGEHRTYTGVVVRGDKFFPAWKLSADHWYIDWALNGLRAAGLAPQLSAYRFCTNAAYSAGIAGVPTIGFGPSTEGDAHVIDENIRIDALIAAARGYAGIIQSVLRL
ncbi:MAG: YgeY family selenium metabolism-linked hydrolase [Chloroflexota bacterium]|nr:YgeY family selenium metabolism-linked hydrolase [Chloroflexota bacterium]